jgi:hypothetical protein
VKYIRYIIYTALLGIIFGGGYGILSFLKLNNIISISLSWQGILYIGVFASIPLIAGIEKEIKYKGKKIEGITNNYLENVAHYVWEYEERWKETIEDIINGIVYNNQVFCLEYQEEDYIRYVSEKLEENVLVGKKKKVPINRIIIEVEKEERKKVSIIVHKEMQYIELSNKDNEEILKKIVKGLISSGNKLTHAST